MSPDLAGIETRLVELAYRCAQQNDRSGYFAASYIDTTRRVRAALTNGRFRDPDRVLALTVAYAGRFLATAERFRRAEPVARCWQIAFELGRARRLTILQHVLLGMNAHINFDLPVVLAETFERPAELAEIRPDFRVVNSLLKQTVDSFQARINRVSPIMRLIDIVGWRFDEATLNFSVYEAREAAWTAAVDQVRLRTEGRMRDAGAELERLDRRLLGLSRLIIDPGRLVNLGLRATRVFEDPQVSDFLSGEVN